MIAYFVDFIFALSIVGILAGFALVIDAIRRLKEQTTEPPRTHASSDSAKAIGGTLIAFGRPRSPGNVR
jgi:hypothetical protein